MAHLDDVTKGAITLAAMAPFQRVIVNKLCEYDGPLSKNGMLRFTQVKQRGVALDGGLHQLIESGYLVPHADGYEASDKARRETGIAASANAHGAIAPKESKGMVTAITSQNVDTDNEILVDIAARVVAFDPSSGPAPIDLKSEIDGLPADMKRQIRALVIQTPDTDSAENGARFTMCGLFSPDDMVKAATESKARVAAKKERPAAVPKEKVAFDGVAQPTQDCIRVISLFAKAHNLSQEQADAITQRAIELAKGERRATHTHALDACDALSDKNKTPRFDRTQLLNPAEAKAYMQLVNGTPWANLDTRGRAGARYFGLVDSNGVLMPWAPKSIYQKVATVSTETPEVPAKPAKTQEATATPKEAAPATQKAPTPRPVTAAPKPTGKAVKSPKNVQPEA